MVRTNNEDSLREAICDYLSDSSQENYLRLKKLLFGECEDHNIFKELADIKGTKERSPW